MAGISEVLWDENGNFLGRNLNSWAKILGFYAIYYSFLGFLFYGFTISYYLNSRVLVNAPVGSNPAVANARLDMPGSVVHPFVEMMDARDDMNRISLKENDAREDYCKNLGSFFDAKDKLNAQEAKDCSQADFNTTNSICNLSLKINMSDDKVMNENACNGFLKHDVPMFTIDINKIIGWKPSDVGIHFKCYEYDEKNGKELEKQEYTISWLGQSFIPDYYFPYNGVSKDQLIKLPDGQQVEGEADKFEQCSNDHCQKNKPYNKPFVTGVVHRPIKTAIADLINDKSEDFDVAVKGEHVFRCDILSDKITRQQYGDAEEGSVISKELRGLNLGFVEFGFKFAE